eukprot:4315915-Pyramimonas_sp.AAC.1
MGWGREPAPLHPALISSTSLFILFIDYVSFFGLSQGTSWRRLGRLGAIWSYLDSVLGRVGCISGPSWALQLEERSTCTL